MTGLARRVSALERAQLVDLDAYVRQMAANFGLDPEAAAAESRRMLADIERHGRDGATKRWAAAMGLSVPTYRAKAAAIGRQLRANDATNDGRTA